MLIKVGITGGIGSGKSVVSRLLEIMGIPVYISDTEAKRITCTDTVIRRELCALVGQEVFQGRTEPDFIGGVYVRVSGARERSECYYSSTGKR